MQLYHHQNALTLYRSCAHHRFFFINAILFMHDLWGGGSLSFYQLISLYNKFHPTLYTYQRNKDHCISYFSYCCGQLPDSKRGT